MKTKLHKICRGKKTIRGFTLIELVVTLAIAALLLALALPDLSGSLNNSAVTSKSNDLSSGLRAARTSSVSNSVPVVMCPTSDQINCCPTCQWDIQWFAFTDCNNNGKYDQGGTVCVGNTEPEKIVKALSYDTNTIGDIQSNFNPNNITFFPSGLTNSAGRFAICGQEHIRSVQVTTTGLVQTSKLATCP